MRAPRRSPTRDGTRPDLRDSGSTAGRARQRNGRRDRPRATNSARSSRTRISGSQRCQRECRRDRGRAASRRDLRDCGSTARGTRQRERRGNRRARGVARDRSSKPPISGWRRASTRAPTPSPAAPAELGTHLRGGGSAAWRRASTKPPTRSPDRADRACQTSSNSVDRQIATRVEESGKRRR